MLDDCYETIRTTPIDSSSQVFHVQTPYGGGNVTLDNALALRAGGMAMAVSGPDPHTPQPGTPAIGDESEVPKFTFFIYDHLGNSRILYTTQLVDCNPDSTKYLLEHVLDYYPYGRTLREYVFNRERFQTTYHERDQETGLDYRGARFYDGDVGRFLSVDPLADHPNQVDKSTYSYAWNNPVLYDDPDGRCPQCLVGFVIGFGLDVATQMIFEGKSLENVNYTRSAVSGVAGALSGGLSTLKTVGTVGKVVAKVGNVVIDGGESIGHQVAQGQSVTWEQTASDIFMGAVGGNAKVVGDAKIKVQEGKLDRVTRVADNAVGGASSGRLQNVKDAKGAIVGSKGANQAAATATGNTLKHGSNEARAFLKVDGHGEVSTPVMQVAQDNTRVVVPLIKNFDN